LLNPTDPNSDDRKWIAAVWLNIIRRSLGLPTPDFTFGSLPAACRVSVTSPAIMKTFADFNAAQPYADQIKPSNFLLTSLVKAFGHPTDADPQRFHLIAPYDPDARNWLKNKWIDQYGGKIYRITSDGHTGSRQYCTSEDLRRSSRRIRIPSGVEMWRREWSCFQQANHWSATATARSYRRRYLYREGIESSRRSGVRRSSRPRERVHRVSRPET